MLFGVGKKQQQLETLRADKASLEEELTQARAELAETRQELENFQQACERSYSEAGYMEHRVRLSLRSEAPLGHIRDNAAHNASKLLEEQRRLDESSRLFGQSTIFLQAIRQQVDEISRTAESSKETVDNLEEAIQSIYQFTGIIAEISDQTNLLVLNAAIEAARAGEQGRGFAVVAEEVRNLAAKTTGRIKEHVNRVSGYSAQTKTGFENMVAANLAMREGTDQIDGVIGEVTDLSSGMIDTISRNTSSAFVETVKLDHILYKLAIYQVLAGRSDKGPDDFASHHHCRLGKWYFEGDGAKLSGSSTYQALNEPHETVREAGVRALRAGAAGDTDGCLAALAEMGDASEQVVELLSQLEGEYFQQLVGGIGANDGDVDLF